MERYKVGERVSGILGCFLFLRDVIWIILFSWVVYLDKGKVRIGVFGECWVGANYV